MDEDYRLTNRLAWVTAFRLLFLSFLLGATAFFYLGGKLGRYEESQSIVFWSIGLAFALSAAYAVVLRSKKRLTGLAESQLVLDQLTWTAIVYVSGGASSGATSFYGLTCLVGAVLVGLRGAAIAGISGLVCFLAMCTSFAAGWIHPPPDQATANYPVSWNAMAYPILVNVLGIVVVTLLAGYLAERLRTTGGALILANERALRAERLALLGSIAAGLAHEIRNPLGSISGSIEMLREAPGMSDDDRRLCEIVQREAGRLNDLVTDMLDLSRPRPAEPEMIDVALLARDVVALASRSERSGSGDVAVRYEGPAGASMAFCDPNRMRQVLWNLVRNAVQASAAGSAVVVGVAETDTETRLSVKDEGQGIPPEMIGTIFDGFYTTRQAGSGIGLAVVRKVIDEHAAFGASIRVVSEGHGTIFEVTLPRVAQTPEPSAAVRTSLFPRPFRRNLSPSPDNPVTAIAKVGSQRSQGRGSSGES